MIQSVNGVLNVMDFGAQPGGFDNSDAFQAASDYMIQTPGAGSTLYIPAGQFFISRPWILQKVSGTMWEFFTITIQGACDAKSGAAGYITEIIPTFTNGFAIGVQFGRGIVINNVSITGKYKFPNYINNYNIGTTLYSAWNDGSVEDKKYAPYAGICIDPFCDPSQLTEEQGYTGMRAQYLSNNQRGGTSGMWIQNCAIHNFVVGIMLTPNPFTQNDEMINIIDDCIDGVKVCIAIGQDQSKEIHIDRLKVWASTYTILDGLRYGTGGAPCSVIINGMNVAGNVNQLFNISAGRFPLSASSIYAESLFRIGYVYGAAGVNFQDFQIDILTGAGMPAADYIFYGGPINWSGGMLRYYDSQPTHRMNLSQMLATFKDMTMTAPPMVIGLYAYGINGHPTPTFQNINMYYQNVPMKADFEAITAFPLVPKITIYPNWTASFTRPEGFELNPGDYIMASPTDKTGIFYDQDMAWGYQCSTIQIGRVTSVVGDLVTVDQVSLNAYEGDNYGAMYVDRIK